MDQQHRPSHSILYKLTLVSHAGYIFVTALWPLVDIQTFMDLTGPKHDVWLVKTVGALLIPISLTMFCFLWVKTEVWPLFVLAIGTALAFIAIDVYYAVNDVISNVYLIDAVVEGAFVVAWMVVGVQGQFRRQRKQKI